MDFGVGMRVHKSNNHPTEDICDVLAGDYPKTFKFSAWHPQCRCYVTSILCTKEEMMQMQRDILAGNYYDNFRDAMIKLFADSKKIPTSNIERLIGNLSMNVDEFTKELTGV